MYAGSCQIWWTGFGVDAVSREIGIKPYAINEMSILAYFRERNKSALHNLPVTPPYKYYANRLAYPMIRSGLYSILILTPCHPYDIITPWVLPQPIYHIILSLRMITLLVLFLPMLYYHPLRLLFWLLSYPCYIMRSPLDLILPMLYYHPLRLLFWLLSYPCCIMRSPLDLILPILYYHP